VGLAICLDLMPEVRDALASGGIDVRKAPSLTVPALRARMRHLELVRDPQAGEHRHTRARADLHVTLTAAPDAMAWLAAFLPADDALRAFTALDAIAIAAAAALTIPARSGRGERTR